MLVDKGTISSKLKFETIISRLGRTYSHSQYKNAQLNTG